MADSKEILTCPSCGKKMQKIFLNEQNFNIDICLDGCGGIFFDNRELKKVDEKSECINEILAAIKDKKFTKPNTTAKRRCPACNAVMVQNNSKYSCEFKVDECYSCGGVFLDSGELLNIRKESSNEEEKKREFERKFQQSMINFLNSENK